MSFIDSGFLGTGVCKGLWRHAQIEQSEQAPIIFTLLLEMPFTNLQKHAASIGKYIGSAGFDQLQHRYRGDTNQ